MHQNLRIFTDAEKEMSHKQTNIEGKNLFIYFYSTHRHIKCNRYFQISQYIYINHHAGTNLVNILRDNRHIYIYIYI